MPPQKKNEWLEADESEEGSEQGYDSESEDRQRGSRANAHKAKRRKLDEDDSEDLGDSDDPSSSGLHDKGEDNDGDGDSGAGEAGLTLKAQFQRKRPQADHKIIAVPDEQKVLTPADLKSSIAASNKAGVIYLSRVPPFMKPQKVKQLLSRFGTVGRVFLQPEDPASYARRKRFGGNKKRNFEDGWVEFADKKVAKLVVETLNATTIGGKKGNYYHDDVWNMKYLKGFKWHHLTEQIANENAERAARLRADISRTNRENKLFVRNVERAKMLENMDAKKKSRRAKKTADASDGVDDTPVVHEEQNSGQRNGFKRHFRQNEVRRKGGDAGTEQSEDVKRVLSKIF